MTTSLYQCFAQTPSVSRNPGGHDSIASSNSTSTASHNNPRILAGFSRTSRASITGGAEPLSVTISIGVATTAGVGDTAEALLKRSDEAVYAAKAAGRNTVIAKAA